MSRDNVVLVKFPFGLCMTNTVCMHCSVKFLFLYRVHRQLVSVFARGPEPVDLDSASSSQVSMDPHDRTDQDDLIPSPK